MMGFPVSDSLSEADREEPAHDKFVLNILYQPASNTSSSVWNLSARHPTSSRSSPRISSSVKED